MGPSSLDEASADLLFKALEGDWHCLNFSDTMYAVVYLEYFSCESKRSLRSSDTCVFHFKHFGIVFSGHAMLGAVALACRASGSSRHFYKSVGTEAELPKFTILYFCLCPQKHKVSSAW